MTEPRRLWLQITSGRGPAECQLAVAHLTRRIEREAKALGLTVELLGSEAGDERGTLRSSLLSISGAAAAAFSAANRGSVQWIAPSPFRPGHKRKNWFVGVDILTPPDEQEAGAIKTSDVVLEAMRASGPGGQHVNKTESAVRATHRPTGLVATAREERSQAMNKRLALARLAAALAERVESARAGASESLWTRHDALERGQPRRIFKGPDFREVKTGAASA